jgi:hypothetical protein
MGKRKIRRERTRRWHLRDEAVIDHLVAGGSAPRSRGTHTVHGPDTASGTPVQDQVRKEWRARKGGLPTF